MRSLHRVRSAESGSSSSRSDEFFNRKSDDRSRVRGTFLSFPHLMRLWMKQINLDRSPPPVRKLSENGGIKDQVASDQMIVGASRSPKGPAFSFLKCIILCCVSLFILVAALGSTSWMSISASSSHSSANNIYRGYRRLREQVMADFSDIGVLSLGITRAKELGLCSRDVEDFIPCYNVSQNELLGYTNGEEYDRHCGAWRPSQPPCLVRPPKDYKIPLRWPTGRDVIWSGNVKITKEQLLSSGSLTKRLMLLEDSQISFRSEDALVVDGVEDYSHQIAEMIGLRNESEFIQAGVHTVLDIGCGFGSFGAHLFSKQLLTMCIASYEVYGSQVQLALERGLPAMLGSFVSRQLPYPSLSFDMVHCARCGIEWDQKDGAFLIEVDRVLKPGGYFVWTSPLTNLHGAMLKTESQKRWKFVQEFTEKLCWVLLSQQEETVLWQKTSDKNCYELRKLTVPPVCNKGQDAESPYYQPLLSCIGGTLSRRWMAIQNQSTWPNRKTPSSNLLAIHAIPTEEFIQDSQSWTLGLKNYWSLLTPLIFSDHPKRPGEEDPLPPFNMLRNVMDMNARYGGLNAALLNAGKTVWVMNVIPTSGSNTLPVIYDRGFVGVLHDWCEAFPTYPRTYDMLHADGLLSQERNHQYKCGMLDLFVEMDRILRPEGWVVLRDEVQKIEEARSIAAQLRWDARIVELEDDNDERLLVCQKPFVRK
uniref:Methyltransferase n=1 Tax=Wollemia nobilis TaxID=56998 RepID=A0A0C9RVR4_9CONI